MWCATWRFKYRVRRSSAGNGPVDRTSKRMVGTRWWLIALLHWTEGTFDRYATQGATSKSRSGVRCLFVKHARDLSTSRRLSFYVRRSRQVTAAGRPSRGGAIVKGGGVSTIASLGTVTLQCGLRCRRVSCRNTTGMLPTRVPCRSRNDWACCWGVQSLRIYRALMLGHPQRTGKRACYGRAHRNGRHTRPYSPL